MVYFGSKTKTYEVEAYGQDMAVVRLNEALKDDGLLLLHSRNFKLVKSEEIDG